MHTDCWPWHLLISNRFLDVVAVEDSEELARVCARVRVFVWVVGRFGYDTQPKPMCRGNRRRVSFVPLGAGH